MDKEALEVVLKKFERESRIASIIDVKSVPALPKGENYTSTIFRLKLKVVLGNGRLAKKSLILKQLFTKGGEGEPMKQNHMARIESQIYSVIHKEMTHLMEEFEDNEEPLWCDLIHYDPHNSCILLEDLLASGYSVVPRQKGLDLDHAILALRGLGRYHGMAKVLEERGIISKDDYNPSTFFTDLKLIKCIPYGGILNVSKVLKDNWGPAWEPTAKMMMMIAFDPFAAKQMKMAHPEESEFTVLNHGDCWSNNMMFKYDFKKRPMAVKFVDYQLPHYNTPCMDVTNFIYLSVQPAIRRSNYELLLRTYHESLVTSLEKFGFTGTKPTLQEITATMDRLEFLGLTLFITVYPGHISSSTEPFIPELIIATEGKEGFNTDVFKEPGIEEKLGPDIMKFVEKHVPSLK